MGATGDTQQAANELVDLAQRVANGAVDVAEEAAGEVLDSVIEANELLGKALRALRAKLVD